MVQRSNNRSIKAMVLTPMLAVNMLMIAIFLLTIDTSQIINRMQMTQIATVERSVEYRGEELEKRLNDIAAVTMNLAENLEAEVAELAAYPTDISGQIRQNPAFAREILDETWELVADSLRFNESTGAFLILDNSAQETGESGFGQGGKKAALYFCDQDVSTVHNDYSDLMLFCGPNQIARDLNIPLDHYWMVEYSGEMFGDNSFLSRPYDAAREHLGLGIQHLGYWSRTTRYDGQEIALYTVPLRDANGQPFGIAGVEVTIDHLKNLLSIAQFGYPDDSFFAVTAFRESQSTAEWWVSTGSFATRYFHSGTAHYREVSEYGDGVSEIRIDDKVTAIAVTYPLNLYYSNSPYQYESWGLVGGVDRSVLFHETSNLQQFFLIATALAVVAGVTCSILAANLIVKPIQKLSSELQQSDPEENILLTKTQVKEIDMLIDSIEDLSMDLMDTGKKTMAAIEMTEMPMGFVEVVPAKGRVFLTDYLLDLFGLEKRSDSNYIPLEQWEVIRAQLENNVEDPEENIYLMDFVPTRPFRWLKIKMATDKDRTFGIIIDSTEELLEKRQLEFARDTDLLTGLLNRQAFFHMSQEKMRYNPGKLGLLLFADLDNLKYVNDTYGHDFGDRYIRAAASVFGMLTEYGGVVSRISGDEFAIFLYGYESKEQLTQLVSENYGLLDETQVEFPDGSTMKIRCSMGYSWYPQDSESLEQLLRYADFAMYETKRSTKGQMKEFDMDSYLQNSYLVEKNEDFNQFIEKNQVSYVLQPIVDAITGEIYAYEMLMRPDTPGFQTPHQVLEIARTQAKLYQIEQMTVYNIHDWIRENADQLGERRIFYNSIPDQLLSDEDIQHLKAVYGPYLSKLVVELTENERSSEEFIKGKIERIRDLGCSIAIDDYGSGYSNELIVFQANPDYIKIDMSLVQNVHREENKQQLIQNIIHYSHPLGIRIVAEGIETLEEAEAMIKLGADYLQGYYLGVPTQEPEDIREDRKRIIREISSRYRDRK